MLLSGVCQSWFGMAFSNSNSLTGVFQQALSSLDGHNNSAELSSILGRDSFAALFSVSENTSFFTRLFVVKFGIVVLVTVHWNTMVYLSHSLCVTSPSKLQLGVLKSVVGFAAIAVAMLLTLAIFVRTQIQGHGGGRSSMRDIALLAAMRAPGYLENILESVRFGSFFALLVLGVGTLAADLPSMVLLGGGLMKRRDQSSIGVLRMCLQKRLPFVPQANQVLSDLFSIQVVRRTAAAACKAAFFCGGCFLEQQRHCSRVCASEGAQASVPCASLHCGHLRPWRLSWLVPCASWLLCHSLADLMCLFRGPVSSCVGVCVLCGESCPQQQQRQSSCDSACISCLYRLC